MKNKFKDKVVLITGVGGGIGQELVHRFNDLEAKVIATDIKIKHLEDVFSKSTTLFTLDVTSKEQINNIVNKVFDKYGCIDILVNNAGLNYSTNFENVTEEEWDEVLNVNLKGTFLTCQAVLPFEFFAL